MEIAQTSPGYPLPLFSCGDGGPELNQWARSSFLVSCSWDAFGICLETHSQCWPPSRKRGSSSLWKWPLPGALERGGCSFNKPLGGTLAWYSHSQNTGEIDPMVSPTHQWKWPQGEICCSFHFGSGFRGPVNTPFAAGSCCPSGCAFSADGLIFGNNLNWGGHICHWGTAHPTSANPVLHSQDLSFVISVVLWWNCRSLLADF